MLTRVQTRTNRIGQQSDNTTLTIRLQPSSPVTYSLRTVFWSHHITSIYHRRKLVGQRYPSLTLKRPFISGLWIFDSYIVMNVCVHFNMNGGGQVVRRLVIWPLVLIRPQCPPRYLSLLLYSTRWEQREIQLFGKDVLWTRLLQFVSSGSRVCLRVKTGPRRSGVCVLNPVERNGQRKAPVRASL